MTSYTLQVIDQIANDCVCHRETARVWRREGADRLCINEQAQIAREQAAYLRAWADSIIASPDGANGAPVQWPY